MSGTHHVIFPILNLVSNEQLELELNKLDSKHPSANPTCSILKDELIRGFKELPISHRHQFVLADYTLDFIWEKLNTGHWCSVEISWRKLFTLVSILKARTLLLFVKDDDSVKYVKLRIIGKFL